MPKQLTIAQAQQQLPNLPGELTDEPIIITQDGVPVMAALSYAHLTELLETLDILTDNEFITRLRQSIVQSKQGNRAQRPTLTLLPSSFARSALRRAAAHSAQRLTPSRF